MKTIFILLLTISCSLSCSKTDAPLNATAGKAEIPNQSNSTNAAELIPTPTNTTPKVKLPVPKISDFSIETFFRHSTQKDEKMNMLPPFQYGELSFFIGSKKVKTGDFVTAIPLQIDDKNLWLKIKKIKTVPFLDCDREKIGTEVEFEKITDRRLLEMDAAAERSEEQPFEFFVFYPGVKNAKKLKQADLTKKMLPENVNIQQVVAAIDLNDDGNPDLLVSSYCCYDSSQCDCTVKHQNINSKWKYLGGSEPC